VRKDPYLVLGVRRDADLREIKRAYRALALRFHPDSTSDPRTAERFLEAREAYELLANAALRRSYDLASRRRARRPEPLFDALRPTDSSGDPVPGGGGGPGFEVQVREAWLAESGRLLRADLILDPIEAAWGGVFEIPLPAPPPDVLRIRIPPGFVGGDRILLLVEQEAGRTLLLQVRVRIGA
jgi:curved DNA-binding protein CbpA